MVLRIWQSFRHISPSLLLGILQSSFIREQLFLFKYQPLYRFPLYADMHAPRPIIVQTRLRPVSNQFGFAFLTLAQIIGNLSTASTDNTFCSTRAITAFNSSTLMAFFKRITSSNSPSQLSLLCLPNYQSQIWLAFLYSRHH